MPFPRVTSFAHDLVATFVKEGDHVIDATVGNGHDARFLAALVGPSGRVDGFDLQPEAIDATRRILADMPQVVLHCLGHEHLARIVSGPVTAVMFNLGYLPSGDKTVITRPETTLAALEASWDLLKPGGVLSVVVYPGHAGGLEESIAVESWFSNRQDAGQRVVRFGPAFFPKTPTPCLFAVER